VLLSIDEGTFVLGAIGPESDSLSLLQALFEVTDVRASVSIGVSALSLRCAVGMVTSVAITMSPVVLALAYFQGFGEHSLEHTLVGVDGPAVKHTLGSLAIFPVASLDVAIRINNKASAIPHPVGPFSDVSSVDSSVLKFFD